MSPSDLDGLLTKLEEAASKDTLLREHRLTGRHKVSRQDIAESERQVERCRDAIHANVNKLRAECEAKDKRIAELSDPFAKANGIRSGEHDADMLRAITPRPVELGESYGLPNEEPIQ